MDITQIILPIISIIIALFSVFIAAKSAGAAERSIAQQRGTHDLTAFRDFVLAEYSEQEFKATTAPIINGTEVSLLRAAKSEAIRVYKENPEEWDKASSLTNQGAWQNQVAFETAWALNHLRVIAFVGSLPLRMVLGVIGDSIIDDWLLCRSWVKSYQESEQHILHPQTTPVYFHRRHAEWLVLVTVAWMTKQWSYTNCDQIVKRYSGHQNISSQIQSLSHADGTLMSQSVRDDIRSLTGIEV